MKVVIVSTDETPVAMGVKAISSNLLKFGFDTKVVIMSSWDNDFKDFHWRDLENVCKDAELIGISCMTHGLKKATEVKNNLKVNIKAPIIIGGIHATLFPDSLFDEFDFVCHGEGEDLIVDLAKCLRDRQDFCDIPGLWVKSQGKIFKNKSVPLSLELNEYPLPDYNLDHQFILESNRLVSMEQPHIIRDYFEVMGSRGCPHSCNFCSNYKIKQAFPWRSRVRQYSVDYFINHLKKICRIYPVVNSFWLEDDTFFAKSLEEIKEFASRYKKEVSKPFCILISPWTYDKEKVRLLVDAGMDRLIMGIQSGSENTNSNIYSRKITNSKILEIIKSLNNFQGLLPCYDFIGMNPFEAREDLINTIKLIRSFPTPFIVFSNNLAFYPGTKLRERAIEAGLDIDKRDRHTDAKHGYSILISENIEHKLFHFIFLMMGGKSNKYKVGLVFRPFISDKAIKFYSFLDHRCAPFINIMVALLSIVLMCLDWKSLLKKILSRKQISKLKEIYSKLFK